MEIASNHLVYQELVDENALGIFGQISARIAAAVDVLREYISRQEILAVVSVVGTFVFIAAVGYVMTYLVYVPIPFLQSFAAGFHHLISLVAWKRKLFNGNMGPPTRVKLRGLRPWN